MKVYFVFILSLEYAWMILGGLYDFCDICVIFASIVFDMSFSFKSRWCTASIHEATCGVQKPQKCWTRLTKIWHRPSSTKVITSTIALTAIMAEMKIAGEDKMPPFNDGETLAAYSKKCKTVLHENEELQDKIRSMKKTADLLPISHKFNKWVCMYNLQMSRFRVLVLTVHQKWQRSPEMLEIQAFNAVYSLFTFLQTDPAKPRHLHLKDELASRCGLVESQAWDKLGHLLCSDWILSLVLFLVPVNKLNFLMWLLGKKTLQQFVLFPWKIVMLNLVTLQEIHGKG